MKCCNCGAPADHRHHIVPRSVGGTDRPSNLAPLCERCHGLVHQTSFVRHRELVKKGIERARERGAKIGGRREAAVLAARARKGEGQERAESLRSVFEPLAAQGLSMRQMAAALNAAGHRTERGSEWSHKTVGRVLERLELLQEAG